MSQTIGFIGGGNMAQALVASILEKGLFTPQAIWISDVRFDQLAHLRETYDIRFTQVNTELTAAADIIVLCVKPQVLGSLLDEIAGSLRDDALVISIVAGKTSRYILDRLGQVQLVRVMPNTPAMVGASASGLFNATAPKKGLDAAISIFQAVGTTAVVDNEDLMDAVTAVSGSGPAYFFLLMEEMIKTGVKLGLDEKAAADLVIQTACGAALLAQKGQQSSQTPEILRKNVTSPGGTTEAAVKIFQAAGFQSIVKDALTAARDRGRELSAD